jgi:hypothetical protein
MTFPTGFDNLVRWHMICAKVGEVVRARSQAVNGRRKDGKG